MKTLVGDETSVVRELIPAIKRYNKEQLIAVKLPGGSQKVIVSEYNEIPNDRFFDVEARCSFAFDYINQKASDVQSYVLESRQADLVQSLIKSLSPYVADHYCSTPAYGVYPTNSDTSIALVITGNKYSPSNYWNGRWRSVYTFDPTSETLKGEIKVDVHYYEDGNVRLITTKQVESGILGSGETAPEVLRAISKAEKAYQEELNRAFGQLSEGAFKNLRRQLPVTRQKIDWEKIGSYRLGQEIGGARGAL